MLYSPLSQITEKSTKVYSVPLNLELLPLKQFISSKLCYYNSLDCFSPIAGCLISFLLLQCFIETSVLDATSVKPDQTTRLAAPDLDLHNLPITLLGVSRLKWVEY